MFQQKQYLLTLAAADCMQGFNTNTCGIARLIALLINVLSAVAGVVIVVMIIVGGIQYSTARDNPQAVAAAKGRIINAVLALAVLIFGLAFLQWLVPGGIFQ